VVGTGDGSAGCAVNGQQVEEETRELRARQRERQTVALRQGALSALVSFFAIVLQYIITCMEWVIEKLAGRVAPDEVPDVVEGTPCPIHTFLFTPRHLPMDHPNFLSRCRRGEANAGCSGRVPVE
jgi:hypothetical protein